jgi:hypothetical protein
MTQQHPWWTEPERNQKWEVQCFDSHGRPASSIVYVAARSEQAAIATGKYWMRVIGIKRRGTVRAKHYHPERDPAFQYGDWRIVPATGSTSKEIRHAY